MTKSSKKQKTSSAFLHIPRARIETSKIARSKETSRKIYSGTRRTILFVIIIAMLMVILATLSKVFLTPEQTVKQKIEEMTADYYENYFYPQLTAVSEMQDAESLTEKMKRYETPGFSTISLRQLLLFYREKNPDLTNIISAYCNENKTFVQIFPEPPFEKNNYRVEYHYSCEF